MLVDTVPHNVTNARIEDTSGITYGPQNFSPKKLRKE
jgi:hypothetical protein